MSSQAVQPVEAFEALLYQEELEERVEFIDWSAGAECTTDFDGETTCTVSVEGEF